MLKIRTPSPKMAGQITSSPSKTKLTIGGSSPKSWAGKHLWVRYFNWWSTPFLVKPISYYLERDLNPHPASPPQIHLIPGCKAMPNIRVKISLCKIALFFVFPVVIYLSNPRLPNQTREKALELQNGESMISCHLKIKQLGSKLLIDLWVV